MTIKELSLYKIISSLIFFVVSICVIVYYFVFYQSPENCYFEQMGSWSESVTKQSPFEEHIQKLKIKYILNDGGPISQDRAELLVSEARSILSEYSLEDITNFKSKKTYLKMKTSFDYCGL